jgi:rRNA maturation RNase YbeY
VAGLVRAALAAEGVADGSVTVALVDEQQMAVLNLRFRQVVEPTDVLSFRSADSSGDWPDAGREIGTELGEIVVCMPVVKRYAAEEGGDPDTQAGWTLIHGLLHLLGYDHERDEGQMRARERDLLEELAPQVKALSAAAGR